MRIFLLKASAVIAAVIFSQTGAYDRDVQVSSDIDYLLRQDFRNLRPGRRLRGAFVTPILARHERLAT
jgi:hypothetical protein